MIKNKTDINDGECDERQKRDRDEPKPFNLTGGARHSELTRSNALRDDLVIEKVVIKRDEPTRDTQGKHIGCKSFIPTDDPDGCDQHNRIHQDSLVPAEHTRRQTHHFAEIETSESRNERLCPRNIR